MSRGNLIALRSALNFALLGCLLVMRMHGQMVPDTSFGTNGWSEVDVCLYDEVMELVPTSDGGLLLLAQATEVDSVGVDSDVILAKMDAGGNLQMDFGIGGVSRFDFGGWPQSIPVNLAVNANGEIAVLGTATTPVFPDETMFHLLVLDSLGNPLSTFGDGGWVAFSFISHINTPKVVKWQPDGKLLLAGASFDTAFIHRELPVLARLLPNGSLDSTFGGTGMLQYSLLGGLEPLKMHLNGGYWNDLLVEPSGRILSAGAFANGTNDQCWMMAVTPDGRLDSTFSGDALAGFNFTADFTNSILRMLPLPDGRYGLAIHEESPWFGNHFYMAVLDAATDAVEWMEAEWTEGDSKLWDADVDSAGNMFFAGHGSDPSHSGSSWPGDWCALAGTHIDGSPNSQVGTGGRWSQSMAPEIGGARAVLALDDGRVLLAGTRYGASTEASDAFLLMLRPEGHVGVDPHATGALARAYPNPFVDRLVLESDVDGVQGYSLLDSQGRVLLEGECRSRVELDLGHLPKGCYFLRMVGTVSKLIKVD